MQTMLITGGTREEKDRQILILMDKLKIASFNQLFIEEAPSVSIDTIRSIKHSLVTKSFSEGNRAVIIHNFDKATLEAQNAFLKTLEEPPPNTYIIVVAQNINQLLPTILSRSQLLHLSTQGKERVSPDITAFLKEVASESAGAKLLRSQTIGKDKKESLDFLTQAITTLRQELLCRYTKPQTPPVLPYSPLFTIEMIRRFTKAREFIERNVNPRLTIEVLLLGIKEKNT